MLNVFCVVMGMSNSNPDTSCGEYLLSAPTHVACVAPTGVLEWERVRLACRGYCLREGIMSPYWSNLFRQPESFAWDCKWAKERLIELKGCPPESDTYLFAYYKPFISQRMHFNRSFHNNLKRKSEDKWATHNELCKLEEALNENERLYVIWGYLGDAFNGDTLYQRRAGLNNLKIYLGDEEYYAGQMPHNVPNWAFNDLD